MLFYGCLVIWYIKPSPVPNPPTYVHAPAPTRVTPTTVVAESFTPLHPTTVRVSYTVHEQDDAFTTEECKHVIEYMKDKLTRSTVTGQGTQDVSNDRTSQTGWIYKNDDNMSRFIDKLLGFGARLSGVHDRDLFEDISVVNYNPTQEYKAHFDACATKSKCKNNSRIYRRATVILYLNDDFEGGETYFPNIDTKVHPKTGKIVMFYNTDLSGKEIEESLHAGLPIMNGEKWICTLWIKYSPESKQIEFLDRN
jgi:prolyl 4-hydroxylase